MLSILHSLIQKWEVKCGPRFEAIVSGTPKQEIQKIFKALAHAGADVLERITASIHLDVQSMMVKI
jgi:hypothetical protein